MTVTTPGKQPILSPFDNVIAIKPFSRALAHFVGGDYKEVLDWTGRALRSSSRCTEPRSDIGQLHSDFLTAWRKVRKSSDNYFLLGQNLLSLEHGRILNSTSVVHSGSLESPNHCTRDCGESVRPGIATASVMFIQPRRRDLASCMTSSGEYRSISPRQER